MKEKIEFKRCSYKQKEFLTPSMELLSMQKGEEKQGVAGLHSIIFILQGSCHVITDCYQTQQFEEDHMVYLPLNSRYHFTAQQNTLILLIQGDLFQNQMGAFSLENLYKFYTTDQQQQTVLPLKPLLKTYAKHLEAHLKNNFYNIEFFDIKIQELRILLTLLYSSQELAGFFRPVLNSDLTFANFVLNKWHEVATVQELVELSHYCETGFRKKFRQVFGLSPYKWIQQKRSERLYYEIVNNEKPLKVIAEEYGFKSLQHFNEYCHRYFRCPPGNLRKKPV